MAEPRLPCHKLGVRFESDDMVKRFLPSGRTGFHVAVLREGEVGAGDQKLEIRKVKLENGEEKIRTLPDGGNRRLHRCAGLSLVSFVSI